MLEFESYIQKTYRRLKFQQVKRGSGRKTLGLGFRAEIVRSERHLGTHHCLKQEGVGAALGLASGVGGEGRNGCQLHKPALPKAGLDGNLSSVGERR